MKDVSFSLQPGELTGVLGPNGAGKTTLFNSPDRLHCRGHRLDPVRGTGIAGLAPYTRSSTRVARPSLTRPFLGMTVLENAGGLARRRAHGRRCNKEARAHELLDQVGLGPAKPASPSRHCPMAICGGWKLPARSPPNSDLLLLDEPFAGLGSSEIESRLRTDQAAAPRGKADHPSDRAQAREFMALVSRVIAIDFGEIIAVGPPAEIVRNPRVIEAYIGKTEADHASA